MGLSNGITNGAEGHVCPPPALGMLPVKISEYAAAGKIKEVFDWIESGGDINAAGYNGLTLLHVACKEEQRELLKKLLEHPDIHFNTRGILKCGLTPLSIAVMSTTNDILEILLNAKSPKCTLSYSALINKPNNGGKTSAILIAAHGQRWQAVRLLLQNYLDIREWEAFTIFVLSVEAFQFDIAKTVIDSKFSFKQQNFTLLIKELHQNKQWKLLEATFRKTVQYNNDTGLKVFLGMFHQEDLINLEKYLSILNGEVKIQSDLLESILKRNNTEAVKILQTVRGKEEILTGTLLAACIGGTNEELANILLKQEDILYSDLTLDNALLLAAMHHNIEFIQNLINLKKYSLKMFYRALNVSRSPHFTDVSMLMTKLIEEKIKKDSEDK